MGEKTASQVQDVVVAGSQSSNFLLPKENKSPSRGVPRLTMVGLCSDSGQPNKAYRGYCPFCWSAGTGAGGGGGVVVPHTHTQSGSSVTVRLTSVGPRCSCWGWNNSKSVLCPFPPSHSASIRLYYCISGNSSQNKPCPIVMIVLISAV